MKRTHKFAMGIVAASGIALTAATAYAHPEMGGGMGPGGMGGMGGMGHGMGGAMGHGPMGGAMAAQQLMTPEEHTALMEKMRNAKTPEERQKLAEETHAEMQKRAKEKGITLPEHRGPMGFAPAAK